MKKLVVVLIAFVLPLFAGLSSVDAQSGSTKLKKNRGGNGVFVHITAVLNEKNGGLEAEVTGFNLGKKLDVLASNEFKATIRIRDNKLQIRIDEGNPKVTHVTLPGQAKLSEELSQKLGSPSQVVMSGGTTMIRKRNGNRMLWFEIQ